MSYSVGCLDSDATMRSTHAVAEWRRLGKLTLSRDFAAPEARRASRSGCDLARFGDCAPNFAVHVAVREVCHAVVTIRP
ncbi:hypothetical protein XAP412_970080 [Xanthomonas phaseoli pv. phaseoli]|uniref:Uncharacterized protein n=1 Tax=Xanthomonas campestris pv. phaseoli TaxID=317013 RepID=A0AB38E6Q8_XANCH|nr:hypothetical protein XAP6984_1000079 [Xanthomonas phaseoli pv. phaseoli]SON92025.1 hypothetical protein XAP412_970080 [Xanthomonas phaseoli pv. phaseoli]SON93275.1 hypothetical protein XAP7430_990080 [Xanthomonas phaseoli pv. phaseoli]